MTKPFEEFQVFGKDNYEAFVASASAFTRGLQAIAQEAADYSRRSFEKSTEVVERVTSAKSIEKAIEVQQGYAKEAYEAFVGQMGKFGELYVSTAKEAYKPFESGLQAFGVKSAGK